MIFGFLVNMENTIKIYPYSTPWALFPQNDSLPLNSLFWSSPIAAVHRFDASDMAVPDHNFLIILNLKSDLRNFFAGKHVRIIRIKPRSR